MNPEDVFFQNLCNDLIQSGAQIEIINDKMHQVIGFLNNKLFDIIIKGFNASANTFEVGYDNSRNIWLPTTQHVISNI